MSNWNKKTEAWLSNISANLKKKRVELFIETLNLGPNDIILDLGSEDGSYLSSYYPYPENIVLADIFEEPMKKGVIKYKLKDYVVIPKDGPMPIKDQEYNAVWCNSAIEHVTVERSEMCDISNKEFIERGNEHQKRFAMEISRISKKYFVQTPYLHFPVEAHSWLPFMHYLTQPQRCYLSRVLKKVWVKQWSADFYAYNRKRFYQHFPDATEMLTERAFLMPKSIIAVKK